MTFRLLMIGAMYENGGNTTHRLLDGHPQLYVYPFESQLGTNLVGDHMSSVFPNKYRWPVFDLAASAEQDYSSFIDEETRVRARTPQVSKFRHVEFEFSDDQRRDAYLRLIAESGRSRAHNVAAFFRATFNVWRNHRRAGSEEVYVGYSPIVTIDADKVLQDFPEAYVLHVVRNPWSAYADTCKRPVPLSLRHYMVGWTVNQQAAFVFQRQYPGRVHILRFEDVVADPAARLGALCKNLGLESADSLRTPSWNGQPLAEVYPWGTIRTPTPEANQATAAELAPRSRSEIRDWAEPYLDALDYRAFQ